MNTKALYIEFAEGHDPGQSKKAEVRPSRAESGAKSSDVKKPTEAKKLGGPMGVRDRTASGRKGVKEPKMDISELMNLLKHENLYGGPYGVNAKQVHEAWKRANDGGEDGDDDKDQDKLQLDWDEYQVCIHIIAAKLGVELPPPEGQENKKEEAKLIWSQALKTHWSDERLFLKFCAGAGKAAGGAKDNPADKRSMTMDFREFIALCEDLGIHPGAANKTQLAKIFREANSADSGIEDDDAHELQLEEFQYAMLALAMLNEVPVIVNGRDIAQPRIFK
mmetsp:Transcript_33843/g.77355  ORF Transcript_33843/g.77355 Transcript_33843/m.77355 type:complete len:278 (-) Transcript_33843:36-869(-)